MKINPRFPGDMIIMEIRFKYNSQKVLGFISTEGSGITDPGDPYLSFPPYIHSIGFICPVV